MTMTAKTKAQKLGCTSTVSIPISWDGGRMHDTIEVPCTPPQDGLCIAFVKAYEGDKSKDGLRVTHVASGMSLFGEAGTYPATSGGLAGARHELASLLPLADWTQDAGTLKAALDQAQAEVVARRCRLAFPGKLIAVKEARRVDDVIAAVDLIKWTACVQHEALWVYLTFVERDLVTAAVRKAMSLLTAQAIERARRAASTFNPDALACSETYVLEGYTVGVQRDGDAMLIMREGKDTYLQHLREVPCVARLLADAQERLAALPCPKRSLGVWRSGPKIGQLRILAKTPLAECEELIAAQARYDAQAKEVAHLREYLDALRDPADDEHASMLHPAAAPGGRAKVEELLAAHEAAASYLPSSRDAWPAQHIGQLRRHLREYVSVDEHGFAPGTRCVWVDEYETHHNVTVKDMYVTQQPPWRDGELHYRDIITDDQDRWTVPVSALRKGPTP